MKLADAKEFAHTIMDTRGLRELGWTFEFDKARRRFGCTHFHTKTISVSKVLTELNDEKAVHDTILHEIAHAIAGYDAGHGYQWKSVARVLGCSAERTYSSKQVVTPPKRWKGICPNCSREVLKHRRGEIACGVCCKVHNDNNFTREYLFIWKENK